MTFLKNFKTVPAGRKVSQKCGTFFSPGLSNFFLLRGDGVAAAFQLSFHEAVQTASEKRA